MVHHCSVTRLQEEMCCCPGMLTGSLCLSVTQDLLSTFGLDLLFLEGGFLRKSVSDFSLLSRGQRLRAAQVCGRESGWGAHTWRGVAGIAWVPHPAHSITILLLQRVPRVGQGQPLK